MTPAEKIDQKIASFPDWRGGMLAKLRKLVNEADPELKEDWKWDTAVWGKNSMVCAIGAFKNHVKLNLFKGWQLKDEHKLINSGFDSKGHRAIDFYEGGVINETAIKDLVQEAVELNSK